MVPVITIFASSRKKKIDFIRKWNVASNFRARVYVYIFRFVSNFPNITNEISECFTEIVAPNNFSRHSVTRYFNSIFDPLDFEFEFAVTSSEPLGFFCSSRGILDR